MTTRKKVPFDHTGSAFDSFLEVEGTLEEVEAAVIKRVIAWQLATAMSAGKVSKKAMAQRMGTSRSQLDRLSTREQRGAPANHRQGSSRPGNAFES